MTDNGHLQSVPHSVPQSAIEGGCVSERPTEPSGHAADVVSDAAADAIAHDPARPAIVVCGSLAIDVIGYYGGTLQGATAQGRLTQSIQLDRLDVDFGGCAMNIAYSLALLGARAYPVVRVGRDFRDGYAAHLQRLGISDTGILVDEEFASSSHCIVLSDRDGNQLTAFYPGSSNPEASARRPHRDAGELGLAVGARLGLIAPDVAANMIRHAELLAARGIPFVTDPGQGLPDFDAGSARALIERSRSLILNAQEWQVLLRLLGTDEAALRRRLDWIVVTLGAEGCRVLEGDGEYRLPAIAPTATVDHTGCGDALRGGLLYGLARGTSLEDALRIGTLTATYNLEARGCQRHDFTGPAFVRRYEASWQRAWPLPRD